MGCSDSSTRKLGCYDTSIRKDMSPRPPKKLQSSVSEGNKEDDLELDTRNELLQLCQEGKKSKLRAILKSTEDLTQYSDLLDSGLFHAAQNDHSDCVHLLLRSKANINSCETSGFHNGRTPLMVATVQTATVLLAAGADVNFQGGDPVFEETALHYVAGTRGDVPMVNLLLENKAEIDPRTSVGQTPLASAASMGQTEIVQVLLEAKGNVNSQDDHGFTPLMHAVCVSSSLSTEKNSIDKLISLLIDVKGNLDLQDREGRTALMLAIHHQNSIAVKKLLDARADLWIQDKRGQTAKTRALLMYKQSIGKNGQNAQTATEETAKQILEHTEKSYIPKSLSLLDSVLRWYDVSDRRLSFLLGTHRRVGKNSGLLVLKNVKQEAIQLIFEMMDSF